MKIAQYVYTFLMGYFLYSFVEVAGRGYTHWTMALTGGLVLSVLYAISGLRTMNLIKCCFIGAAVITCIEFAVGVFDNIIMGWQVWDYSDRRFNILGQICPLFTGLWFLLCIPAFFLCRKIRSRLGANS